ncbi:MAG: hypothetical protein P4M12_06565 [Gammaproteobacteria bacterium]|nr:hypothetical protein [Gammaproteobacteria bacterium]
MKIQRKKIVNSNTLRNLVKTACNKYEAMEKSRLNNDYRSSKLTLLKNLIADKKSSSNHIAKAILEFAQQDNLGTKLKAITEVLAVCARAQLEKNNFENAFDVLATLKTKTFEENFANKIQQMLSTNSDKTFNFEKAFQNIIVSQAISLTKAIQQKALNVVSEKHVHTHTEKPVALINAKFISQEKSKTIANAMNIIELQRQIIIEQDQALCQKDSEAYPLKKLVVKSQKNANQAVQLAKSERNKTNYLLSVVNKAEAYIARQSEDLCYLAEALDDATAELAQTKAVLNKTVEKAKVEKTELRIEKVWEKKAALDKAKEVIMSQGREINSLKGHGSMKALRGTLFNQQQTTSAQTDEVQLDQAKPSYYSM